MTVIAWDGKILAVDRQINSGDEKYDAHKSMITPYNNAIAWDGTIDAGLAMMRWFCDGAVEEKFPYDVIGTPKDNALADLVIVRPSTNGGVECFSYTQTPFKHRFLGKFKAWGSGGPYAVGAMGIGASAIESVKVACKHCNSCGLGIDWYDFSDPKEPSTGSIDL